MNKLWHRLFLEERPSISLSFFRLGVALTVGCHVIPSFFHLEDTFFHTAFKSINPLFFPIEVIEFVQRSPDSFVLGVVILFCLSWFFFLVGLFSQISCIVMTLCCYYLYALNAFVVGALSWDILMVTLFVMCVTPYHGDYFSLDALRRGEIQAYKRKRPYFIQRLLQMQVAFTYFYTGLVKVTASGNWLKDNPIYYLVNYPVEGVTKQFLLKDFFAHHPELCYAVGVLIVVIELSMPFLLFNPRTRVSGIYLGFFFHIVLVLTLDVPAIFFFLFPPQLLLFIHPDLVIRWIDQKRQFNQEGRPVSQLVYDGHCQFCRANVRGLQVMDLFATLKYVDYQSYPDIKELHPKLTKEVAHSQIHLIEPDGVKDGVPSFTLYGGFFAFRRLCLNMPMLYPSVFLVYFPGAGILGPLVYRWIANNRYLFHVNKTCEDNACFR